METKSAEAMGRQMLDAVKSYVGRALATVSGRLDEFDERLKAIPAGAKGDQGERGLPGESIKGDVGAAGEAGPKADAGDPGAPGEVGPAGERGQDGQPGPKGNAGERGADGVRGEVGPAGESIKGDPGQPGKDGLDGKSVELDAVSELISIEVAEAIGKLPKAKDGAAGAAGTQGIAGERGAGGAQGEVGPDGASIKGEAGEPGRDGKDGASIHPDTVALMVREAVDKAVAALPAAKDGAPGRDAAELTVLAGIDEARSYPAGTYAKHNGGEIRAERRTDPVKDGDILAAGWTVARDGVSALVVTQGEDPREISVAAMLTSGTKAVSEFHIPMVIDKGVWREGEYEKGDHVSRDGSGWIAQCKTVSQPGAPGTGTDWRLSTKRGQNGKDADREPPKAAVVRVK